MIRVWSEHLPLDLARTSEVTDLLCHGPLHPFFAVPPGSDLDALASLLRTLAGLGLEPGIWPLLEDADGYWPSERNGAAYFAYVDELLRFLEAQKIHVPWIAVDLEPPLQQVDRLRHSVNSFRTLLDTLQHNFDPEAFTHAVASYQQGMLGLRERGYKTLAVTVPMAAHDLRDGSPLWQDLFEAPWSQVGWDRVGIMAYGSMVSGYSKGLLSTADARAIHYRLFKHMARAFGSRAHASLGITGIGKLGDEPIYDSADELARDASAARAAGIDDIAIFCLEGLVGREDAGAWVEAVAHAPARAPEMTILANSLRFGAAAARFVLGEWHKRASTPA